jgi:integrin alpha FG-GAP repeat containing protein 1
MDVERMIPNHELRRYDDTFRGVLPIPLRIGDFNNDGYPDLLVVTHLKGNNDKTSLQLLESKPCDATCSKEAIQTQKRTFSVVSGATGPFKEFPHPVGASFVDIGENGVLDLFVFTRESNGRMHTHPLQNQFTHDSFFLSYTVLNNLCLGCMANHSQVCFDSYSLMESIMQERPSSTL